MLLQCAIPVFDGLLPEPDNFILLSLLHTCAYWHSLAKLHMHTEKTLDIMDHITTKLGDKFCHFEAEICSAYTTRELPHEARACQHRQLLKANTSSSGKSINNK